MTCTGRYAIFCLLIRRFGAGLGTKQAAFLAEEKPHGVFDSSSHYGTARPVVFFTQSARGQMDERVIGMTDFLIRLFLKNKDPQAPGARVRYGNLASLVGLFINLLLAATKFVAGTLSGSLAVTADAINNLSDSLSSVLAFLSFYLSARPADEEHPYGHSRMELLLSLVVGVSILAVGGRLLYDSVQKIIRPTDISFSWLVVGILVLSILLKWWLWAFYRKIGRKIGSDILKATAADSISDVLSTSGVLLSVALAQVFHWQLDGWMGVIISLLILKNGGGIVKENVSKLLGQGANSRDGAELLAFIQGQEGVLGAHDLLIHEYGGDNRYATVDCEVHADMTVEAAHNLADRIEREVSDKYGYHLVIHVDPVRRDDERMAAARRDVEKVLQRLNPEYTFHDLRLEKGKGQHVILYFDLVMPGSDRADEEQVMEDVQAMLTKRNPHYQAVMRVDRAFD